MWSPRTQGALGGADTFPELGAAAVTAALVPPLARGLAGDGVVGMMTEEQEFFIAEAEHALGPVTRREEVT